MYEDFVRQHIHIPFYANMKCNSLGLDSREQSYNVPVFDQHPAVHYLFNEVGFRTHSVAKFDPHSILVIGDSFTVGLGINADQRYTDIMEKQLQYPVLNFGLNGASNDWIARKLKQLLSLFDPRAVIVHYTFSHRRERPCPDWHDDERTECEPFYSTQENFDNWHNNYQRVCDIAKNKKLIHSFIPNWHDTPIDYAQFGSNIVPPVTVVDRARDNFHYGIQTHQALADTFTSLLAVE